MTQRAAAAPPLRDLTSREARSISDLLDAAFSGYRDATRFAPPVLEFLDEWAWSGPPLSVGIETASGLVAVGLGSLRHARFQGQSLTAVHLGPIGVKPGFRRRGLGGRLLQALEERARAQGADVLTLTTEVVYGAWRLYQRQGFEVLETYRPRVRPLYPGLPKGLEPPSVETVETLDAKSFAQVYRQPTGRPGAIVEQWTHEPSPPRVLRPHYLRCHDAAIATMRWPVLVRSPEGRLQKWTTQILRICGQGAPLTTVLTEATRLAHQDQAVCIYALPTVAEQLPGFLSRGTQPVHRMIRALTPRGERIARAAKGWDEVCPAP